MIDFENEKLVEKKGIPENLSDVISDAPGGSYLSNEIFYRVAKMRKEIKPELPTGHFHINKIQDESIHENLELSEIDEVLKIVNDSIKKAIKSLY